VPGQGASGGIVGKWRNDNVTLCVRLKRVNERQPPAAGSNGRRDERQGDNKENSHDHGEEGM
jgi:hypothetical protein